jgi:hypothetical protein
MDEIVKIHMKNRALIRARNYLLEQSPSDMVVVSHITENIVDLTRRHLEVIGAPQIPRVTRGEQQLLRQAIAALDRNVEKKASAHQILIEAKAVYDLKPWPPVSSGRRVFGLKPWPPVSSGGRFPGLKPSPSASSGGRAFGLKPWPKRP